MDKIRKLSRWGRVLCQGLMVIIPVGVVLFWLNFNHLPGWAEGADSWKQYSTSGEIPLSTQLLAIAVSFIPMSIVLYGISKLIKLFRLYEAGMIFTRENTLYLKKIATIIFVWVIVGIFYGSVMTLVLSMNNPVGERMLGVGFGSSEIDRIVAGFLVLLVAHIMDEGRKLKDEQDQVI